MRTKLIRPLGEGEPRLYGRHVQHVAEEGKRFGTWGKGGGVLLRKGLLDEVYADAGEAEVQPGHIGYHV